MTTTPIIHDPGTLLRAGIHTLPQALVFIHIGRCGLNGTTIPRICQSLHMCHNTVRGQIEVLEERKLVTRYGRSRGKGGARLWIVTRRGWAALTQPADTSMFPDSLLSPAARAVANP